MINKEDTTYLVNRFFEKCFEFWVNEGRDDREAFELALKEASEIDRNPFSPMGDVRDSDAHQEYIARMKKRVGIAVYIIDIIYLKARR